MNMKTILSSMLLVLASVSTLSTVAKSNEIEINQNLHDGDIKSRFGKHSEFPYQHYKPALYEQAGEKYYGSHNQYVFRQAGQNLNDNASEQQFGKRSSYY